MIWVLGIQNTISKVNFEIHNTSLMAKGQKKKAVQRIWV